MSTLYYFDITVANDSIYRDIINYLMHGANCYHITDVVSNSSTVYVGTNSCSEHFKDWMNNNSLVYVSYTHTPV